MKRVGVTSPLTLGLAVAFFANVLLIALFLWSPAGQTTVVQIRADGGSFTAFTDGIKVVPGGDDDRDAAVLDVPMQGTIVLLLPPPLDVMPGPSGIDSIAVTGPDGQTLFQDDFHIFDLDTWEVLSGDFEIQDSVLVATATHEDNSLILRDRGWSDYDVAVTYRNGRSGVIGAYVTGDGSLFYHFDLIRDFPNYFNVTNRGEEQPGATGSLMRTDRAGPLRSTAHMLSRGYPYLVAGLILGVAAVLLLSPLVAFTQRIQLPVRLRPARWDLVVAGLIATAAFALSLHLNATYYSFLPHLPDEVAYLFQADLFSHFKVTGNIPPIHEAFYFYDPVFLYERGDQWASFYPFGHPLILAIGELFGAVRIVPSLVGAANVLLTYLIGRRLFDARTGLIAAALLAASPFFLMQSSSFMSHNTAALYFLLALYGITHREKPLLSGALAGLFFGLALNTRLLTAVALAPVFGALMLSYVLPCILLRLKQRAAPRTADSPPPLRQRGKGRREGLHTWLQHTGMFIATSLLMVGALLAYNAAITGDALTSPYTGTQGAASELFGFRDGHALDIGLRNIQAQLMALLIVFNAWPLWAALSLVLLPFLLGTRDPRDYFLAAAVLFPVTLYIGYRYSGIYEGPRYWYETMPYLTLLSARGVAIAGERIAYAAAWLRDRAGFGPMPSIAAGRLIVLAAALAFSVYGTVGWLTRDTEHARMSLVPAEAEDIRGIFGVDDRLDALADEMQLENALVLVKPCGFFDSRICYGSVFLRNLPHFDGPVVWARYDEALNSQTIAAYPNRTVYVATWDPKATIEPQTGP